MLSGTLGGGNIAFNKGRKALPIKNSMAIRAGKGIADVRLTAQAIAAVLHLAVNNIARNAVALLQNGNAALVLAGVGVGSVYGSCRVGFSSSRMGI